MLHSRISLLIRSQGSSWHLLTPSSPYTPLPPPPLGNHTSVPQVREFLFTHRILRHFQCMGFITPPQLILRFFCSCCCCCYGFLGFFSCAWTHCLFIFLFFGCIHGIWKSLGQGSNPHHSHYLSHCSDNTGSLTCCTTRELTILQFFVDSTWLSCNSTQFWHDLLRDSLRSHRPDSVRCMASPPTSEASHRIWFVFCLWPTGYPSIWRFPWPPPLVQ